METKPILSHSPRLEEILQKSRDSIKAGKGLSEGEFWKAVADRAKTAAGGKQDDAKGVRAARKGKDCGAPAQSRKKRRP